MKHALLTKGQKYILVTSIGAEVVPSAVRNTQFLADWAMRKKWENIVVSVQYSDDFVNTIESVTLLRVTYN